MKNDSLLVSAFKGVPGQLKELKYILLIYSLIIVALLGFTWILSSQFDIEYEMFTKDVSTIGGGIYPLYGMISTLGIMLWVSAASICLFVYCLFRKQLGKAQKRFLLATAILTIWLLLDDAFLIHEFLAPFHLHVEQEKIYGIYIILILGYMFYFYRSILKSEYFLLILASLYLGLSVGVDFLGDFYGKEIGNAVEDGLKFFGVATWMLYCVRISATAIKTSSGS